MIRTFLVEYSKNRELRKIQSRIVAEDMLARQRDFLATQLNDKASVAKHGGRLAGGKEALFQTPKFAGAKLKNEMHGDGELVTPTGDRYAGHFEHNKKQGFGECFYSNGDYYCGTSFCLLSLYLCMCMRAYVVAGEWRDDHRHGTGIYRYASGREYRGTWAHDRPNGDGVQTGGDGCTYTGPFVSGQRHGRGSLVYANGDRYCVPVFRRLNLMSVR